MSGETPRTRPRQFLGLFALALIPVAVVVAGVFLFMARSCACQTPAPPTPDVASPVDGVVIAVDSTSLSDVRGFTLRTSGGFAFTFALGSLENAAEFSPSHLAEHQASSEPIRVWFHVEGGDRVVFRLEDAPEPPGS